ncbi:dihydroorotase [bacterium]|nr:dihydroorotase [bacterium]
MKLLIKNGNLVDVKQNKIINNIDIIIESGKIKKIDKDIQESADKVIDAKDKLVCPGLIDMHVHLREPGREDKETIKTGAQSAAAGGFTSIVCMPNTNPVLDNSGLIYLVKEKAKACSVNVYPVGTITKGLAGEEISEIGDLYQAGAVAISDDGKSVMNSYVLRRAMEYTKMFNIPVLSHCEDTNLAGDGVMNEGYNSTVSGLKGIPAQAESIFVARDILLAQLTGARVHIQHVSCKESVAVIEFAKQKGIKITAETTPHYISLTDDEVLSFDTNTKVNPPLRTIEDINAIKKALVSGVIDVIATDHAPHTDEDKTVEFDLAPFGMVGLETAVGVVFTELVHKDKMDVVEVIKKMTINPAQILNLKKGVIEEEASADITIIDPELEWVVDKNKFKSKSHNTPFNGRKLKGKAIVTIVGGKIVYEAKS